MAHLACLDRDVHDLRLELLRERILRERFPVCLDHVRIDEGVGASGATPALVARVAAATGRVASSTERHFQAGWSLLRAGKPREAAIELSRRAKLASERLVLGGRSMGGRYCSLVVGAEEDPLPALGVALLGYPLYAAGRTDQPRADHFPRLRVPVLFVSGTRDSMAAKPDLTKAVRKVKGKVAFHWIDSADHGYRPLKSSGRSSADVAAEVGDVVTEWVLALPS